jgi:hypothetical protein
MQYFMDTSVSLSTCNLFISLLNSVSSSCVIDLMLYFMDNGVSVVFYG